MTGILLINPNTSASSTQMMLAAARPLLPPGMALRGTQTARGAAMILDEDALAAAAGGRRFGIATTTPHLVRSIEDGVRGLGLDGTFTGVRVPDADPLRLAASPAEQDDALALAAVRCMELDGAEAVVIGGGPLSATAARLRGRFGTAIVEPLPAAMRQTLAALATRPPQ